MIARNIAFRIITGVVLLAALALAGCNQPDHPTVRGALPGVPADIQTCFRAGPAKVPQKALTVAEVESLWKQDRVHEVVLQRCGKRFLAWYGDLQRAWR
jgi:predicted small secreted protein